MKIKVENKTETQLSLEALDQLIGYSYAEIEMTVNEMLHLINLTLYFSGKDFDDNLFLLLVYGEIKEMRKFPSSESVLAREERGEEILKLLQRGIQTITLRSKGT